MPAGGRVGPGPRACSLAETAGLGDGVPGPECERRGEGGGPQRGAQGRLGGGRVVRVGAVGGVPPAAGHVRVRGARGRVVARGGGGGGVGGAMRRMGGRTRGMRGVERVVASIGARGEGRLVARGGGGGVVRPVRDALLGALELGVGGWGGVVFCHPVAWGALGGAYGRRSWGYGRRRGVGACLARTEY
ncbi:hypothetical protein C8R43DRAFT_1000605 [Mycena crocata]|nr:hypothetical protein C8R43DRAFT_1000605 [Mycena crocata]